VKEADVAPIVERVLHPGVLEKLPIAAITDALNCHGVREVHAAFAPAGTYHSGVPKDLWFACDVGLLYCTLNGGGSDALALIGDLTAWRDVRDVELGSRIARVPEDAEVDPTAREVTEMHLLIQVPRIDVYVYGTDETGRLGAFAREVLLRYSGVGAR
jgi:hypothetical protein